MGSYCPQPGGPDALCRARGPQGRLGPTALPSTQQHSLPLAPPPPLPPGFALRDAAPRSRAPAQSSPSSEPRGCRVSRPSSPGRRPASDQDTPATVSRWWPWHWGRSSRLFLGRVSSTYRPARAQPENNQDTAKPRHERNCPGLGRADGASLSFPVCQSPDPSFCNDRGQPGLPAGHLLPRAVASGQGHRPGPVNGLGGQWAPV